MTSSCYSTNNDSDNPKLMSRSLDPTMFRQNNTKTTNDTNNYIISEKCLGNSKEIKLNMINTNVFADSEPINSPLQALSKMVPVPESLMSPDYRPPGLVGRINSTIPTPIVTNKTKLQPVRSPKPTRPTPGRLRTNINPEMRKTGSPSPARQKRINNNLNSNSKPDTPKKTILRKSPSSEEESEICDSKLQTIQMKAEERRMQKDAELSSNGSNEDKVEQAVVFIQKMWRGYYTRNKNKEVQEMFRTLQNQRANQYIQKLASDMENTKAALESERKIQMLQTEAISALWKKISALQPETGTSEGVSNSVSMTNLSLGNNTEVVKELAQTCTMLQNQVHIHRQVIKTY